MSVLKFYKYNDRKAFKTLYEVISWESDRGGYSKAYDNWIEEQAKAYLEEAYDWERINKIFWGMRSLRLIDIFKFEKIDVEVLDDFDRTDLNKLIKKYKTNEQVHLKLLELKKAFEDDLKDKRIQWANERANDDFSCFIGDIDIKDDKQVAQFFGISDEVIGYVGNNGDEFNVKEVIGFCSCCHEPITERDLFCYNPELERDAFYEGDIGKCDYCSEGLHTNEITDEDIKLMVKL